MSVLQKYLHEFPINFTCKTKISPKCLQWKLKSLLWKPHDWRNSVAIFCDLLQMGRGDRQVNSNSKIKQISILFQELLKFKISKITNEENDVYTCYAINPQNAFGLNEYVEFMHCLIRPSKHNIRSYVA